MLHHQQKQLKQSLPQIIHSIKSAANNYQNQQNDRIILKFQKAEKQWNSIINQLTIENSYLKKQVDYLTAQLKSANQKIRKWQFEVINTKMDRIKSQFQIEALKSARQCTFRQKQKIFSSNTSVLSSNQSFNIADDESLASISEIEQFRILGDPKLLPQELIPQLNKLYRIRKVRKDSNKMVRAFYIGLIRDLYGKKNYKKINEIKQILCKKQLVLQLYDKSTVPIQFLNSYHSNLLKTYLQSFFNQITVANTFHQLQEYINKYPLLDFALILLCKVFITPNLKTLHHYKAQINTYHSLSALSHTFGYNITREQLGEGWVYSVGDWEVVQIGEQSWLLQCTQMSQCKQIEQGQVYQSQSKQDVVSQCEQQSQRMLDVVSQCKQNEQSKQDIEFQYNNFCKQQQ